MQEMVPKGEGTPKAMAEVNVAGKNSPESRWCRNLRSDNDNLPKLPNTDDKMKPDSPTCAIDADEIIMMGKMELEKEQGSRSGSPWARQLACSSLLAVR